MLENWFGTFLQQLCNKLKFFLPTELKIPSTCIFDISHFYTVHSVGLQLCETSTTMKTFYVGNFAITCSILCLILEHIESFIVVSFQYIAKI